MLTRPSTIVMWLTTKHDIGGMGKSMTEDGRFRKTRRYMTFALSPETDNDLILYLQQRRQVTGVKMTKQQFIETAIMRELARVRGKDPINVPDAPNYHQLGRQRRKRKDE
jgi:hypothetical protein